MLSQVEGSSKLKRSHLLPEVIQKSTYTQDHEQAFAYPGLPGDEMNIARPTWVFGYGSLIWKQDFPFLESRPGRIEGWVRRFWQGSHDHRGVQHDPGRVVTLVAKRGGYCDGCAFLVEPAVFDHLDYREKNGYERVAVDIIFGSETEKGVVYRAAEDNVAFLGPASVEEIAVQINRCNGPSGSNRDYALNLANALRKLNVSDSHVFEVETRLLQR